MQDDLIGLKANYPFVKSKDRSPYIKLIELYEKMYQAIEQEKDGKEIIGIGREFITIISNYNVFYL